MTDKENMKCPIISCWAVLSLIAVASPFQPLQCGHVNPKRGAHLSVAPRSSVAEREKSYLATTIRSMLLASGLIYRYAKLRKLVNQHDPGYMDGESEERVVNFKQPEIIVTQKGVQSLSMDRYLRYPVTAAAVQQFVVLNRNYIEEKGGDIVLREFFGDIPSSEMAPLTMEDDLKELQDRFDADIQEFDDEFSTEELVYGITVNRSEKRITVVFRGSVELKDWKTNLRCTVTTLDQFNLDGNVVKVHTGFANYVFGDSIDGPSKYERIVKILIGLKREQNLDGYELFVTGHSLGGALCALISFALADTPEIIEEFGYVTGISFATPPVGNKGFKRVSETLEKQGKLRHIRVSNQGDAIPAAPFRLVPPFPSYIQTGVNLHSVKSKKMEIGWPNVKSTVSQLWDGSVLLLNLSKMHSLPAHEDRMLKNAVNGGILVKTIAEIYDEQVWSPDTEGGEL